MKIVCITSVRASGTQRSFFHGIARPEKSGSSRPITSVAAVTGSSFRLSDVKHAEIARAARAPPPQFSGEAEVGPGR